MPELNMVDESFSIEFSGPALHSHEISASALAQSLLALDGLAHRAAEAAYGHDANISIKVKGSPRQGSFLVDLLIQHSDILVSGASAITILMGIIALGKWAFGKKVEKLGEEENGFVNIKNEVGNITSINAEVVNIYNQSRTFSELSRLTQTLDREGVDSISLLGQNGTREIVTKEERNYFRHSDGIVLSDTEATMELEITGARFNGSPIGWTFYEGENGREFSARVEDDAFLQAVKENKIIIKSGTTILATIRTVQKKLQRTVIERSIVAVIEVLDTAN